MISEEHQQYLHAMGIRMWRRRDKTTSQMAEDELSRASSTALDPDWQVLKETVLTCTKCALHCSRKQAVFGTGDCQADLLIIGEAPGANEDQQGEPFVGRAGMLLTAMLQAIGLNRPQVYIANVLKCRPPNNRDPLPSEVECCTGFLKQQIALIQPKLIVAVGRIAAHFLLDTDETLGRLRGKMYQYGDESTPLLVTYHPAYLLRSPKAKAQAYEDLKRVQQLLDE